MSTSLLSAEVPRVAGTRAFEIVAAVAAGIAVVLFTLFLDLVNDVQKNHELPLQGPVQLGEELCEALAALSLVFGAATQLRK